MRLERLDVVRLPGIEQPFRLTCAPGLNILCGPNAAGKSSVARAVRGLFWPGDDTAGQFLAARFTTAEGTLEATRDGGAQVLWRRQGQPSPAPVVPGGHVAGCYRLGPADLLGGLGGDELTLRLAVEIRRAMTGGFDLDGLADGLPRPHRPTARKKGEALHAARQAAGAIGRQQAELDARRRGLGELDAELERARAAGNRLRALQTLQGLRAATRRLAAAVAEESGFPDGVAQLRDDDLTAAENLQNTIAERTRRQEEAEVELQQLAASRQDLPPPLRGGPDTSLPGLEPLVEACRAAAEALATEEARCESAAQGWADARAALSADPQQPGAELPGEDDVRSLAELHRGAAAEQAAAEALEALARELPAEVAVPAWRAWAPLVGGAALALAGGALVGLPIAARWFGAAAGVLLALWGAHQRGLAAGGRGRGDLARWLTGREQEHRTRLQRLQDERQGLAGRWSLGQRITQAGWMMDVEALRQGVRWRAEHAAAAAAVARRRGQLDAALAAFNQAARPWGREPATTAGQAASILGVLRETAQRAEESRQRYMTLRRAQAMAEHDLDEARKALQELRARLSMPLDEDPVAAIRDLTGRRAAWQEVDRRKQQDEHDERRLRAELTELRELLPPDADDLDDDALDSLVAGEQQLAARLPELGEERGKLDAEIRAAAAGHAHEQALAAADAARDDLAAWRRAAHDQVVEAALLDELRQAHEESVTPGQLVTAKRLFARFTRQAYALHVVPAAGGGAFQAHDTAADRRLDLAELSDGTRSQLLLALRLAFIETAEAGPPLPLFLDEALTTTDGGRLTAIVEALGAMAQETGRQVFYLTSNSADAAAWTAVLQRAGLAEPAVIDLAAARSLPVAALPEHMAQVTTADPPPADGHDAASYGRLLGVPHVDPRLPWRSVDTFHLAAPDLDLARRLRGLGLTAAGPLAAFLDGDGAALLPDADALRLRAAIEVLRAWHRSWRIGRPLPADAAIIDDTGVVTPNWRDQVLQVLTEQDHDAARFLAQMREGAVRNYRKSNVDELEEALRERGCVDERPPLDDDALLARVQADTAVLQKEGRTSAEEVRRMVHRLAAAVPREIVANPSSRPSSGSDPTG